MWYEGGGGLVGVSGRLIGGFWAFGFGFQLWRLLYYDGSGVAASDRPSIVGAITFWAKVIDAICFRVDDGFSIYTVVPMI